MAESGYLNSEPQLSIQSSTKALINELRRIPRDISKEIKNIGNYLNQNFKSTNNQIPEQIKKLPSKSTEKVKEYGLQYAVPAWVDLPVTHPLNTITKRLQNHPLPKDAITMQDKTKYLWEVGIQKSPCSVYNGLIPSMGNKILSRTSKYFVQDTVNDKFNYNFAPFLATHLSDANTQLLIGTASGFVTSMLCTPALYPLETYKVREQLKTKKQVAMNEGQKTFYANVKNIMQMLNPENIKKMPDNVKKMLDPKMVRSAYNGLVITTARDVWASSIFFGWYAYSLALLADKDHQDQKDKAAAAAIAGMGSAFLSNPLDMLKTRKQGSKQPLNLFKLAKETWATEGTKGFFKGVRSNLAQAPFRVILPYIAFTYFKDYLKGDKITQTEVVQINKNNKI